MLKEEVPTFLEEANYHVMPIEGAKCKNDPRVVSKNWEPSPENTMQEKEMILSFSVYHEVFEVARRK